MKKNIAIILALAMVIGLFAGCTPATIAEDDTANVGFGPNNFVVEGSQTSGGPLDPNRTSLTLSASGEKGPETVTGTTTPISTSEFAKPGFTKKTDSSTGLTYYYYKPSTAEPTDGYPILLWLHGTGGHADPLSANNNWWVYNADILKNAVIIAPTWEGNIYTIGTAIDKYWATSDKAIKLLNNIVSGSTYGKIDANRIYMSGYSAGGMATFREVANNDGYFAGAVPIASSASTTTLAKEAALKKTPIWGWHGTKDEYVGWELTSSSGLGYATKGIYEKLNSPLMRYTIMKDAKHADTPFRATIDRRVWSWLFQQKKGSVQTRDYTVEGYIRVVDANGKVVMTEIDCSGKGVALPTYDSATKTFTLTLTDAARKKLSDAYLASEGKEFTVYYGNQKILTYTATGEVDSSMTKFVITNAFSSSYSDDNVLARVTKGIKTNNLTKNNYTELYDTGYIN